MGGVRAPQQRRAARQLGQPRQPDAHERAPELRCRARSRASSTPPTPRCSPRSTAASRRSAPISRAARFRAALAETMRLASSVNQYVSEPRRGRSSRPTATAPATVLYTSLRAVDSLKTLFTPFLPHTSQRVHELLGYEGYIAGPLEFREVTEEDGRTHQVLTGDYSTLGRQLGAERAAAGPGAAAAATALPQARRLDVDEELRGCAATRDRHPRAPRADDAAEVIAARGRRASRGSSRSRRRSRAPARRSPWRMRSTVSTHVSASTRTRPAARRPSTSPSFARCSRTRRPSPSARRASTTSATTRRTTRSSASSSASSPSRTTRESRSSSTPVPPTRTRSRGSWRTTAR